jgi:hypothetical protein
MESNSEGSGNKINRLEALVASSVEKGTFEEEIHKKYPAGMDESAKFEVITAINAVISKNRHDYILNKHGIDINSYDGNELDALPEAELVKANREAGKINEPFYKAWSYVAGIKLK